MTHAAAFLSPSLVASLLVNALCAGIALAAALLVLPKRGLPGALALGLALLAIAEVAAGRLVELAMPDLAAKILWSKIEYVGTLGLPVLLLIFAAQYSGYGGWLTRRNVALLSMAPAITFLLALTNEQHGLIWSSFTFDPAIPGGVIYGHGLGFWIGVLGYSYGLTLIATLLIVRTAVDWHVFRRRTAFMFGAIVAPWLGTVCYAAGLTGGGVDLTPVGLTVAGALTTHVVLRYRLLDLLPIARGLLIEELGDAVLVVDQRGRVVDANPEASRLMGRGFAAIVGSTLAQLPEPWREPLQRAAEDPGRPLEIEIPPANGRNAASQPPATWFEARVTLLDERNVKQRGRLIVLHPITEHKRAQQALNELNAELEQRVAERTAALEQRSAELLAANERLTELHRLKSKFIADVTHELRTPLTNVSLYASLLERGKPEKQAQYLAVLQQEIKVLSSLVGDIVDFGRLAEQQLKPGAEPVNLNAVVAEVVDIQRERAAAGGLRLVFRPTPEPVLVRGDAGMLRRAAENIIINAISFTETGCVEVATDLARPPLGVQLRVSDTGAGIAAADLPHIFEWFYRGQNVGQSTQAGAGLGLPILKEIVDAHAGTVQVDTAPGRGTTVTVCLPGA